MHHTPLLLHNIRQHLAINEMEREHFSIAAACLVAIDKWWGKHSFASLNHLFLRFSFFHTEPEATVKGRVGKLLFSPLYSPTRREKQQHHTRGSSRMGGDVSHSACKQLIYSLPCLCCTLIKCYWLSHEWSWINEWRPSAGLDVNKCVEAVGGQGSALCRSRPFSCNSSCSCF